MSWLKVQHCRSQHVLDSLVSNLSTKFKISDFLETTGCPCNRQSIELLMLTFCACVILCNFNSSLKIDLYEFFHEEKNNILPADHYKNLLLLLSGIAFWSLWVFFYMSSIFWCRFLGILEQGEELEMLSDSILNFLL